MDTLQLLVLFATALSSLILYIYIQAYPRPYPRIPYHAASAKRLWGDAPDMLRALKITQDPAKFIFKQNRTLSSPVAQLFLRPFANPTVIIDDTREVRDILSNRTNEFDRAPRTQDAYRSLLPHCSLVKATGSGFQHQRRFWEGVTGTPFLRRVAEPKMYRCALGLVVLMKAQAGMASGRPFPCFDNFDVAAFGLIWEVVFGTYVDAIDIARNKVVEAARDTIQPPSLDSPAIIPTIRRPDMCKAVSFFISTIAKTLTSFSQPWHLWYLERNPVYKQTLALKIGTINGLIESTRSELANLPEDGLVALEESSALVTGVRRQLLAQIRQGQSTDVEFSSSVRDAIHDELFMLLVAGHETKAVLLSWSVKFLISNPGKQEKLRRALSEALPKLPKGEQQSLKAILTTPIPYLEAYMEESVRVANTSPRLVRTTTVDTQVLGFPIPKGASVLLNPYVGAQPLEIPEHSRSETSQKAKGNLASHWDPNGMDDFQPERWLGDDGCFDPRKFARLGFSAGPRMCYGRNLAMLEFRITLVLLVLNFSFEPLPAGLDSMEPQQRLFRMPRQCYVRISPL